MSEMETLRRQLARDTAIARRALATYKPGGYIRPVYDGRYERPFRHPLYERPADREPRKTKPRPDYDLIRRLEQEIYGECFTRDGLDERRRP